MGGFTSLRRACTIIAFPLFLFSHRANLLHASISCLLFSLKPHQLWCALSKHGWCYATPSEVHTRSFIYFVHQLTGCLAEPGPESLLQDRTRKEMSTLPCTFPNSLIAAAFCYTFSRTSSCLGFKLRIISRHLRSPQSILGSLLRGPKLFTNLEHNYCQTRSEQLSINSCALVLTAETQKPSKAHQRSP